MEIQGLRFALAHISWPWCDENLAVYGKIQYALAHRPDLSAEMFIDMTPGTPPIYRDDALTKLFTVGYPVIDNVLFGTDCNANHYDAEMVTELMAIDNRIYKKLGMGDDLLHKIYSDNLKRFIGCN